LLDATILSQLTEITRFISGQPLSWLRAEVAELYSADNGRPGIDPEVAVRLMLAGFLLGIVHDRRLMREAQVNSAIRWFVGYALHEPLPDHSSLTRIRERWGAERFRYIFEQTVNACIAAKIATGEVVHVDASLIRASVRSRGGNSVLIGAKPSDRRSRFNSAAIRRYP
jgi:transposase